METDPRTFSRGQSLKMSERYFIGIDIGTQGARIVLLSDKGHQLLAREMAFELKEQSRVEQSPLQWWEACTQLMPALLAEARHQIDLSAIVAISVTSTSGTIIPLGKNGQPLHPAIMYSDGRSKEEAVVCSEVASGKMKHGYTAFTASSGLPKMLWYLRQFPDRINELERFIHAADFITGCLCGRFDTTDFTNAMKSGYDLHQQRWPDYIFQEIGLRSEWLPRVRPSGEPLAALLPGLARKWGLSDMLRVTTGMTDGCASQVAAGAVSPGQWNTTIGTTLVIKGVTRNEIVDPSGAIYNHRHPSGYWMPGGASNTGADWVSQMFADQDLASLDRAASGNLPSRSLAWPLMQKGERFPFVSAEAHGFWPGDVGTVELFTSCMEGVAFIERYAYDRIVALSGESIDSVYSAGGASNSDTWLRIRASVLNRPIMKMKNVSGAAGAAILAASTNYYSSLEEASGAMVCPEKRYEPEAGLVNAYEEKYQRFLSELKNQKMLFE